MDLFAAVDILAAIVGFCLAVLLFVYPRFGQSSRVLSLCLLFGALSSAALGLGNWMDLDIRQFVFLSFVGILMFALWGCIASRAVARSDFFEEVRRNRWLYSAAAIAGFGISAAFYFWEPAGIQFSPDIGLIIPLGPMGYVASLYLMVLSVSALANLEQTLRSAEEHVRWEIKFLLLGLAGGFGAVIYIASQILLYAPGSSFLTSRSIRIFPLMLLCSCLLILQSWRRCRSVSKVAVSQGVVYSTITFFSVGVYLITSGAVARWADRSGHFGIPTEPLIFLLSLLTLSVAVLATAFRHRARVWMRKHLFAGRYDYRQFWMEATEQIKSLESAEIAAAAVISLVQKALGSPDLTVWLPDSNAGTLRLIAAKGSNSDDLPSHVPLLPQIESMNGPTLIDECEGRTDEEFLEFVRRTKASVMVPLISSRRFIGVLTVGDDRSGIPFDWETRELLRVISVHFANEFYKAELLSTLVEAREAEAFRTFSTFLLHDLKNFASSLSLIAKNAARHRANPNFQADAFETIFQVAEKMKRLCNELRSFSTNLAADRELCDANEIVESVRSMFQGSLTTDLRLELQASIRVNVDREELSRVLQNLILNANEASPQGGAITVRTRVAGDHLVISVEDQGIGIPAAFIEKSLFQPFQTTKPDGLGIGLFQSRKIVEAHGGKIEVESTEGRGTIFRILLPITEPAFQQLAEMAYTNDENS